MKKIVLCVIIIEKDQERSMYMKKRCLMGAILCCLGLALGSIHPVFAQADDGQNSARENYAAFAGGGDVGIIDVASEEKNAEVYVCGDAVEFSWMEWWYNWNLQNLGTEKNLEELFGYSGTTQVSADGTVLCYASNYTGMGSYRLMALPLGDGGKEPVKIGDDAVMHRILSDNRIVWLKGSSGTLYISDAAGNTQEIASNVENFPFFVNAAETHVLWVERGSTQMSMRTLDLSGETVPLNWNRVEYMSADLQMLIGSRDGNLYIRENLGEEKLLLENTEYGLFSVIQPGPLPLEETYMEGAVARVGASGCIYFQTPTPDGFAGIGRYENGGITPVQERAMAVGVHGDMIAYKKPAEEEGVDFEAKTTYLLAGGREIPLEKQNINSVFFSQDGTKAWGLGNGRDSAYLLTEFGTENPDGKLTILSENVAFYLDSGKDRPFYAEYDEAGVNLVLKSGTDVIDYDGTNGFVAPDGRLYYRVGQDLVFTLKTFDGTQSEVIADKVIEAKARPDGSAAVLVSEDYTTESGTLCLYTKEAGLRQMVGGVEKIADNDISIRYVQGAPAVSGTAQGGMQLLTAE